MDTCRTHSTVHLLRQSAVSVCLQTLLNTSQLYGATVVPALVLTLATGYGALVVTGGSGRRLLACLRPRPTQLQVPEPPLPDHQ